jgi:hypothetical protein
VFGLLDLSSSQIPSGFLLDFSMLPFNDSSYNSLLTSSVDTISESGSFLSVLSILKSSAVNANAATLIATDSMFINAYRLHRNTGYFPLLFLYQAYQRINPTALSSNLFTLSADSLRIMDVPSRSSSPYKTGYCFAFFLPRRVSATISLLMQRILCGTRRFFCQINIFQLHVTGNTVMPCSPVIQYFAQL